MQPQVKIVKTIREPGIKFKLDDPVQEIFKRMRKVSARVLENLKPHPHYLTVSKFKNCRNFPRTFPFFRKYSLCLSGFDFQLSSNFQPS